jgi:hypothetical protein
MEEDVFDGFCDSIDGECHQDHGKYDYYLNSLIGEKFGDGFIEFCQIEDFDRNCCDIDDIIHQVSHNDEVSCDALCLSNIAKFEYSNRAQFIALSTDVVGGAVIGEDVACNSSSNTVPTIKGGKDRTVVKILYSDPQTAIPSVWKSDRRQQGKEMRNLQCLRTA